MSELKNTPWRAIEKKRYKGPYNWYVIDSNGFDFATDINESTAKAIASLPDTLAELELEKYHRRQDKKLAETLHADLKLSNQIHRKLEFELEEVKADNERMKSKLDWISDRVFNTDGRTEEEIMTELEEFLTPKE